MHVSISKEENIHRTNHVCIVLILSRTEFQKYCIRSTAKALDSFVEKRSHVAIWNWVQVQVFNPNE